MVDAKLTVLNINYKTKKSDRLFKCLNPEANLRLQKKVTILKFRQMSYESQI